MKVVITLLLLIALVFLQWSLWFDVAGGIPKKKHLGQLIVQMQVQNEGLEEKNRWLSAEIYDLKNELNAVEERARSEVGLIAPGETFYQLIYADE